MSDESRSDGILSDTHIASSCSWGLIAVSSIAGKNIPILVHPNDHIGSFCVTRRGKIALVSMVVCIFSVSQGPGISTTLLESYHKEVR